MTEQEAADLRKQLADQATAIAELTRENAALRRQVDRLLGLLAEQNDRLGEVASILSLIGNRRSRSGWASA